MEKNNYLNARKVNQKQEKWERNCKLEEGNTGLVSCLCGFSPECKPHIKELRSLTEVTIAPLSKATGHTCVSVLESLFCPNNLWTYPFASTALDYSS